MNFTILFVVVICYFVLSIIFLMRRLNNKKDRLYTQTTIGMIVIMTGLLTFVLYEISDHISQDMTIQSQQDELIDVLRDSPFAKGQYGKPDFEEAIAAYAERKRQREDEEFINHQDSMLRSVLLSKICNDAKAKTEKSDSAREILSAVHNWGVRQLADYSSDPSIENLTFHKKLDTLFQNATYNSCVGANPTILLAVAAYQLTSIIDQAHAHQNTDTQTQYLNSYTACIAAVDEYLRLEISYLQIHSQRLSAILEVRPDQNEMFAEDSVYMVQITKIQQLKNNAMNILAAISQDYDGKRYRHNLDSLKLAVDNFILSISKEK